MSKKFKYKTDYKAIVHPLVLAKRLYPICLWLAKRYGLEDLHFLETNYFFEEGDKEKELITITLDFKKYE